jgi:5-methyltetrahydropteroyltriglutamate--homocysteine methyltransferase
MSYFSSNHVCRGNWSRDETTLLSGGYQALRTYFDRLQITQLVLEYATERAGTLIAFEGEEIGLGVVNPRTDRVETPEEIHAAVEEALRLYPAERVFLNPDCGFGTFSNRPMNTLEIASAKVAAMAAAARDLRGRS